MAKARMKRVGGVLQGKDEWRYLTNTRMSEETKNMASANSY
jgi:hypothetical protein